MCYMILSESSTLWIQNAMEYYATPLSGRGMLYFLQHIIMYV